MLGRLKFEIDSLVEEMLTYLPQDKLDNPDTVFFDPAMGGGQFVKVLEQKFPENTIEGCESNKLRVNFAVNKYKLKGKYTAIDWLEAENTMAKDIIIGNPPFQKADSKAKRWTLWEEFVNKSLDQSKHVAMVVPQSLTSPGPTWDRIKKHAKVINVNVKHHFDVGSLFCYFVVDQTKEFEETLLIDASGEYKKDIRNLPCLPNTIDTHTLDLLDKLISRPARTWKRGELHTSNKDKFDKNGKYEVLHTNAQTLRSNIEHANRSKIRVAVTLSGYPKFEVVHNKYCSQATVWTEFDTLQEATNFADDCNKEDIQEIVRTFKWSGWNSKEIISMI